MPQSIEDLVKKASVILWACDINGIITLQIGGGLNNIGMVENFAVGKSIYELMKDSSGFLPALDIALKDDKKIEALYRFGNNYCKTRISPTENGVVGVCSLENQTIIQEQIKQIDTTVVQTEQFKKDYVAIISHEIRTPLNGITGILSLIKNETNEGYINVIQRSVDSLLLLVNDLLDFSKMENNKMEIESIPFDLNNVIKDIMIIFLGNAREKNIRVTTNISNEKEFYLGDSKRITQIITNLMSNAIKFTETDGNIQINTGKGDNDNIIIKIIDSGLGISNENQCKLFKPYSQIGFHAGTGLGLSICKSLIDLMNGKIGYINNPSTFWVELPLIRYANEIPLFIPQIGPLPLIDIKTNKSVLVVEDDHINNLVLCKYLLKLGFLNITSKRNGKDAFDTLQESVQNDERLVSIHEYCVF
jgi:signal transduction histidine kinase